MKTFIFFSTIFIAGCVHGQYGGLWNGGAFNPWNNPAHPANIGLSNGIAARNYFAWPAAPFIQAAPIPSMFANSPALNMGEVPSDYQAAIDQLKERKTELDAQLREAAMSGGAAAAKFRPGFVSDIIKERMQLVNEIRKTEQELVRDRLALVAKRQQIANQIVESGEPITFGLLMRSLNRAYGREMAVKNIARQKKILKEFQRPFLRPVVSVFAPDGLPSGAVADTKIYQNLKEQKGTLLKDTDFYILTKVSGFSGDKLHLGVDLHGVNETTDDAQALSEDFLETELEFQDEMLESQLEITQKILELQLEGSGKQSDLQKKIMEKQMSRAEKILELKSKLAEKTRDFEEKMADKQKDLLEKQQELLEKEFERQQKLVEKQKEQLEKELEKRRDQLEKQLEAEHIMNMFPGDLVQRQMELNAERVQRQLELARQQALLHNPFAQQSIDKGLEFLRGKVQSFPLNDQMLLFQNQAEKAADLEEKQLEKQKDLLEKQKEKEQDLLEKQIEKDAKAAEKLKDQMGKEQELAQKQLEKEAKLAEKQLEKEKKQLEKEAKLAEKQLEKEAKLAEKEKEKLEKQAEREAEKTAKQLEKEADAAEKQLEKEAALAEKEKEKLEKQAEKEADEAAKQLEKETDAAEKQLEKEQALLEKEQDLAEKELEEEQDLMEKQLEKQQDSISAE